MRASTDLLKRVEAEAARCGTHAEREWLGIELLGTAAGEKAALLRCHKNEVLAWMPKEAAAIGLTEDQGKRAADRPVALSDADRELIRKSGFTEAEVRAHMPERSKKRADGPVALTDADRDYLRRHGHDPALIERIGEVHSPADYQRVKAEVEGKGGAA